MRRLATITLLLLAGGSPALAELVRFTNGHALQVDSSEIQGDKVVLRVAGGTLTVPLSIVQRIGDDEVVAALPGSSERKRAPTLLDYRRGAPVPETPYGDLIHRTARRYRVNPAILAAIVEARSGFDPAAVSERGELGLMLVRPETARRLGVNPRSLADPERNLVAGARYLNFLRRQFGDDLPLVLAGFDATAADVRRAGGVPANPATRSFVARVLEILGLEAPAGL